MTTTKTTPATTADKVLAAVTAHPGKTAAELADITGLGRSTVTKQLANLERDGHATGTPGNRDRGRRAPDQWSPAGQPERLRPGQLDQLVLTYMTDHATEAPHSPTTIARGLNRSSGAVANCLARLTAAGQLRQTSKKPRRYARSTSK
jgi:DNA-binding IclR family transcriptional regulator